MGLVGEQHDPRSALRDFVQRDARIARVALARRARFGPSQVRLQRIAPLAIGEDVPPTGQAERIAQEGVRVDGHEGIHPDGHEHIERRDRPRFQVPERAEATAQQIARLLLHPEDAREPRQMGEALGDAPGKGDEHGQLQPRELLDVRARVLLLVAEHQVGLQGGHRPDVHVLRAADHGQIVDLPFGSDAVARTADQAISCAQRKDVQRLARHQRDHPAGRTDEEQLAPAVVVDAQWHRASSIIAGRHARHRGESSGRARSAGVGRGAGPETRTGRAPGARPRRGREPRRPAAAPGSLSASPWRAGDARPGDRR